MKKNVLSLFMLFVLIILFCSTGHAEKILYVDSYHAGYSWSDDITKGIKSVLDGKNVELRIVRMDTKRNKSEEFKKEAALKVKGLIESWKPDAVIASDDNASKYLIAPYFKNAEIPFVFCGVNWNADVYGFSAGNVTGMVEVALVPQVIDTLKPYSKGSKIGIIASDTLSERKNAENMKKKFNIVFEEERYAETYDDFRKKFTELQNKCDILLLLECKSVTGFDHEKMVEFVEKNTHIPTGAMQSYLASYAMITYSKIGEEQGEWAALTALDILGGKSPKDIPIAANKKGKIYLQMRIAKNLGIKFPYKLIRHATLVK
ncbi:MAG: hypothetical protein GY749_24290 [Desulfobacteraceae bacterium]|nr:hypothetical protein [Desulfobacteraceae bacterium]